MGLDLASLRAATLQLEEALNLCDSEPYRSDRLMQRHLRAASIKAFELTYEISINVLKRHLETISPTPGEVDRMTFSGLMREAFGLESCPIRRYCLARVQKYAWNYQLHMR